MRHRDDVLRDETTQHHKANFFKDRVHLGDVPALLGIK
jgi:hypothetical protein